MSTNVTISTLNPLAAAMRQAEQDPVYGRVYRLLNNNTNVGSWGEAIDVYSDIRRKIIWAELTTLTNGKSTKENREKANSLLDEIRDKLTGTSELLPKAEAMVAAWVPPVKNKPVKSKNKVVINSFAALMEDDENV